MKFHLAVNMERLDDSLDMNDVAQVAIPNDRGLGTTIVSEVSAVARVDGRIRGDRVSFASDAVVEFNRRAA